MPNISHPAFLLCLFRATPAAYGSSQARGWIRATTASLHHSHSNVGSLAHWLRPGIETASSWILVGLITTKPWWELVIQHFERTMKTFLGIWFPNPILLTAHPILDKIQIYYCNKNHLQASWKQEQLRETKEGDSMGCDLWEGWNPLWVVTMFGASENNHLKNFYKGEFFYRNVLPFFFFFFFWLYLWHVEVPVQW